MNDCDILRPTKGFLYTPCAPMLAYFNRIIIDRLQCSRKCSRNKSQQGVITAHMLYDRLVNKSTCLPISVKRGRLAA